MLMIGPILFAPTAHEWLHEFKWHGPDNDNKARMIPAKNVFTKLRIVPQHFYYNVGEVGGMPGMTMCLCLGMACVFTRCIVICNAVTDSGLYCRVTKMSVCIVIAQPHMHMRTNLSDDLCLHVSHVEVQATAL